MATTADIFSHATAYYFPDEAPRNSADIGWRDRLINTGIDVASAILQARYGQGAAIPIGNANTQVAMTGGAVPSTTTTGGGMGLILIAVLVLLFLFMRKG